MARRYGVVRPHVSDGPAPAGARHHSHVALRHGAPRAPGARLVAMETRGDFRVDSGSGSKKNVEVEGQCRDADGAARGAWLRRRALLGSEWTSWRRHAVRHKPDARRP